MNTINCVSNCGGEKPIPEQCQDCGKLNVCSELGVLKDKPCKSKNITKVFDPLGDFDPNMNIQEQ